MKKLVFSIAALLAAATTACQSLPDAVRKMEVNIQSVSFANQNNVEGFLVEYTAHHNSSDVMPIEVVKIDVAINGKKAASYENDDVKPLPNRITNSFKVFAPANLTHNVARESLKNTPMLQVQAKATVSLLVEDDLQDPDAAFNTTATYEGIIHDSNN